MKITIEDFNATTFTLPQSARKMVWDGQIEEFVEVVSDLAPAFVHEVMGNNSPQEPIVIITMDVPGAFAMVCRAFQTNIGDDESPECKTLMDVEELGECIVEHIESCWPDNVDATGRPTGWDQDYIPRPCCISFLSSSIENAYLNTLMAVSSMAGGTWEELSMLGINLTAFTEDEYKKLEVDFPNVRAVDNQTPILFLHMQCADGLVSCKSTRLYAFLKEAMQFRLDAFPEALSSYPAATLWPDDIANAHTYPIKLDTIVNKH